MDVDHLPAALEIFDEIRRPFALNVQQGSNRNGMNYQLRRAGWEDVTEEDSHAGRYPSELIQGIAKEFMQQIQWTMETSLLDERAHILERLEALSA